MGTTIWVGTETRAALRRLQAALGATSADATIQRLLHQPATDVRTLFARHRTTISKILRRHGVRRLVAFGSRARGDATLTSDLDLAIEMGARAGPLAMLAFEADMEELLGLKVHGVELPNPRLRETLHKEGVPFDVG